MTSPTAPFAPRGPTGDRGRRLVVMGFWGLAVFAAGGVALEAAHAFKLGALLDAGHEGRRLLLRLAHAHGAALSLMSVVVGLWLRGATGVGASTERWLTACLAGALALVPGGFLLGAVGATGADPGVGVLLTPAGALLLLAALVGAARAASRAGVGSDDQGSG